MILAVSLTWLTLIFLVLVVFEVEVILKTAWPQISVLAQQKGNVGVKVFEAFEKKKLTFKTRTTQRSFVSSL